MDKEIEFRIKTVTKQCDDILFGTKDHDYNQAGIDILDYYEGWPIRGALHDIRRKLYRLISLYLGDQNPSNESIEDSWRDLINYTRIGYAVTKHYAITREEKKKEKNG